MTNREFAGTIASLLETLGLTGPPLTEPHLRAIAGHLGFELRLDQVMTEDGLTSGETREIRIRRGLSPARELFTIAHELAHVLRGHDLSFARARDGHEPATIRREADAGAGVMLMFGPWLKAKIRELGTDDPAVLAPLFGVSTEAMAIRIKDCQRRNLLTVIEGGGATAAPRDPGLSLAAPQSPSRYEYSQREWDEIERAARLAFPRGTVLQRASLADDLGGVDAVYRVNHRCELQLRVRHDRPAYAADEDVAFRATEPAMIAAGTYAPLAFFLWMVNGYVEAGKLIDVYRMAERIDPPLGSREPKAAGPDGQFYVVRIAELHDCGALLMQGGREKWAPARLGGERDVLRLLTRHLEDSR